MICNKYINQYVYYSLKKYNFCNFKKKLVVRSKFVVSDYRSELFKITNAPITPGIHPHIVKMKVIKKDPQPLSITDNGGKIIARNTLNIFIKNRLYYKDDCLFIMLQEMFVFYY